MGLIGLIIYGLVNLFVGLVFKVFGQGNVVVFLYQVQLINGDIVFNYGVVILMDQCFEFVDYNLVCGIQFCVSWSGKSDVIVDIGLCGVDREIDGER